MKMEDYSLIGVETPEQWKTYHEMRRRILWENRGQFGVYQEGHADEHRPENYPLLLLFRGEAIGVVRVDVDKASKKATMRRVAILETEQRRGHGRVLVQLVEGFARSHGCDSVMVASAEDAIQFYEKCGYSRVEAGKKSLAKQLSGF